jgi:hypothetical protein
MERVFQIQDPRIQRKLGLREELTKFGSESFAVPSRQYSIGYHLVQEALVIAEQIWKNWLPLGKHEATRATAS